MYKRMLVYREGSLTVINGVYSLESMHRIAATLWKKCAAVLHIWICQAEKENIPHLKLIFEGDRAATAEHVIWMGNLVEAASVNYLTLQVISD